MVVVFNTGKYGHVGEVVAVYDNGVEIESRNYHNDGQESVDFFPFDTPAYQGITHAGYPPSK